MREVPETSDDSIFASRPSVLYYKLHLRYWLTVNACNGRKAAVAGGRESQERSHTPCFPACFPRRTSAYTGRHDSLSPLGILLPILVYSRAVKTNSAGRVGGWMDRRREGGRPPPPMNGRLLKELDGQVRPFYFGLIDYFCGREWGEFECYISRIGLHCHIFVYLCRLVISRNRVPSNWMLNILAEILIKNFETYIFRLITDSWWMNVYTFIHQLFHSFIHSFIFECSTVIKIKMNLKNKRNS